jgi:hypothetical protein
MKSNFLLLLLALLVLYLSDQIQGYENLFLYFLLKDIVEVGDVSQW